MYKCVGCGYCCQKATCCMGVFRGAKRSGLCKFLVHDGKRFWCQLVKDHPDVAEEMAIGAGCSSPMFNTQRDEQIKRSS